MQAYAFLGLAMILSVMVAILAFAVMRFGAAARDAKKNLNDGRTESVLLSSALEEAITKLKAQQRATAARAEASERLSGEIVASLTSGLLVVDSTNRIQIANPAARRILQLAEVAPEADYREVLVGADELKTMLAEALRENVPIIRRTITLHHGARPTHLGVTVSPLTPDTEPSGVICLFTDLTNVVALEDQLRLKDSLARLGELTAGLAHEFRNGLATIHGYARLFDPALLPDQYRPYIEGIRSETQALGEVVTNFLKFARPDPLTFAPVDLRTLIARAVEDAPAAVIELRGEFGTIEGDEVLLRQAFSNLFRNSVEASGAAKPPHIVVESQVDAAAATTTIDVSDDGPGIAPDSLGHIFQPFFTTRAGGTGLGLAIVQKVVVSHNGLISAGNRPEGGAIFSLTFPLRGAKVAPNL